MQLIKKIISTCLLSSTLCTAYSQVNSGSQFLGIAKNVYQLKSLSIRDTSLGVNQLLYRADFQLAVQQSSACTSILNALQGSIKSGLPVKAVLNKTNATGESVEERSYGSGMVETMKFPPLNASSKEALILSVQMKSDQMTSKLNSRQPITATAIGKIQLVCNFRISIGSLPCKRVFSVGSLSISKPNAAPQLFTIELSGVDAAAWNTWFTTGASGGIKEKGLVELLTPSLKETAVKLQLDEVEILSYSMVTGANTLSKAVVGLRVKSVSIVP